MHRKMIMFFMALLAASFLNAQSDGMKMKRLPHLRAEKPILNMSHPTRVTSEGALTPSGVKYWDIRVGEGNAATKGHVVKLLFAAWVENGKEFDSSLSPGKPTIFTLGAGQVIPGWEDGMEGMKAGGKRQLRIPPDLAYGSAGMPRLVPPGATLIYDVELLEVQ
jgi:FKBP-type peptidyl-prolyl cis-trans isomerase